MIVVHCQVALLISGLHIIFFGGGMPRVVLIIMVSIWLGCSGGQLELDTFKNAMEDLAERQKIANQAGTDQTESSDDTDEDDTDDTETTFSPSSFLLPVDGTYAAGSSLLFQFQFEEAIIVEGVPAISLNIGDAAVVANYTEGNGSNVIMFEYSVAPGDSDDDGIEVVGYSLANGKVTNVGAELLELDAAVLTAAMTGVTVNTAAAAPDQVASLSIAPTISSTSLSLSWAKPEGNGEDILSYLVQHREQGEIFWQSNTVTTNTIVFNDLDEGTVYEIRVAAQTSVLGPYSAIATAETFNVIDLNPIVWLDANDINGDGVNLSDGEAVASWADKTAKSSPATEDQIALQPTLIYDVQNGLPAVRFEDHAIGLQGSFERTEGTDLTLLIVGQFDSESVDKCMFEFRQNNARAFFIDRRYASNTLFDPALSTGQFNLWVIKNQGNAATVTEGDTILHDGDGLFNTDFTGTGNYVLGDDTTGGNRLSGYIGEFLIFDKALSDDEITVLKSYLRDKWGVE